MAEVTYPLAPQGVFLTCQGEASLMGVPMVFVRLAGCDVNCPGCDTDYSVSEKVGIPELEKRILLTANPPTRWVFLTGGEPTIHDYMPLVAMVKTIGFLIGMATAGEKPIPYWHDYLDYLYISPHNPEKWVQRHGSDLNMVPMLNGFRMRDFDFGKEQFGSKYVTPCDGSPETFAECLDWVQNNAGWKLGIQAHKHWELP